MFIKWPPSGKNNGKAFNGTDYWRPTRCGHLIGGHLKRVRR